MEYVRSQSDLLTNQSIFSALILAQRGSSVLCTYSALAGLYFESEVEKWQ